MAKLQFPDMLLVQQTFDCQTIDDVVQETAKQLDGSGLAALIHPGDTVAITAGSRGICQLPVILKEVVDFFRRQQAKPLIVPAMGSHGGATVEGQLQVLSKLGITPESVGAEIRATMDTVVVAETESGIPVHFDAIAAQADHVFVVNRIKPHTRFTGPIESGLHKMLLIGLGKHAGATIYHQAINDYRFEQILSSVAGEVIRGCRVLGGLAIVENGLDQTALIQAVGANEFAAMEPKLLDKAKQWLPTLPFPDVDLLIVDRIGKNISGTGMDANVIGRKFNDHAGTADDIAHCKRIFVRSLTEETEGNACGIGLAEFTTSACVEQVDHEKTNTNVVTASHPEAGMIPLTYPSDERAITAALKTVGTVAAENAKVIQISDTLHLSTVRMSKAYFERIQSAKHLSILQEAQPFPLNSAGQLKNI
ncbi:MAG: lactate racemase domain-containing protein [Fuerstiella sp.]